MNLRAPGMRLVFAGGIAAGLPFVAHFNTSHVVMMNGHAVGVYRDYVPLPCGIAALAIGLVAIVLAARGRAMQSLGLAALVVALGGFQTFIGMAAYTEDDPPGFDAAESEAFHPSRPSEPEPVREDLDHPEKCPDTAACLDLGDRMHDAGDPKFVLAYAHACELGDTSACDKACAGGYQPACKPAPPAP